MEGINLTGEHDSDDDSESGSKKKKSAEAIGAFVVEPNKDQLKADKPKSWLEEVLGKKPEKASSDGETDEQIAELTAEETLFAEQEIARTRQGNVETAPEEPADNEQIVAEAAVERFHAKIVDESKESTEALAETLAEIDETEAEADEVAQVGAYDQTAQPQEFTSETIDLNAPEDDNTATTSTTTPPPRGSAAAGGSSTPPPRSGTAAAGAALPLHMPSTPGVLTTPTTRVEYVRDYDEATATALIGGIVGYLIGRRRGRIKTERRLLPVQRRLEQQVAALQQDIVAKEFTIRQTAIERLRARSQPASSERIPRPATRGAAPEAGRLHNSAPVEKIGEVLITAQAETTPHMERANLEPIDRHIETMSRADLLELSSKVLIEGTTLRHIYETNLIGEKALRRIMSEHLRGGDIHRLLRREMMERQIDFERDPQLRDASTQDPAGTSVSLDSLLKQASGNMSGLDDHIQSAIHPSQASSNQHASRQHRRMMDIAMISTISVLLALVLILFLTRS